MTKLNSSLKWKYERIPEGRKQMVNLVVLRRKGESLTLLEHKLIPPLVCWLLPHPVNTPGCALCFFGYALRDKNKFRRCFFSMLLSDCGETVKALKETSKTLYAQLWCKMSWACFNGPMKPIQVAQQPVTFYLYLAPSSCKSMQLYHC